MKWLATHFPTVTKRQLRLSVGALSLTVISWFGATADLIQIRPCPKPMPVASTTPGPSAKSDRPEQLSLLAYNLQLRPRLLFANGQSIRAEKSHSLLHGYDVLILSETFDDRVLNQLITALRPSYPYVSLPFGDNRGLSQDSGLVIFSRWPIEPESDIEPQFHQRFKSCHGTSCFNEQGILTVSINKNGKHYRLLTAQFQGGSSQRAQDIRTEQIQQIQTFILKHQLLRGAPIIFAISLPIATQPQLHEFKQQLIQELNLTLFQPSEFSVNPNQNSLVQFGVARTPDILFTFNSQPQPQKTQIEVKPLRIRHKEGWKAAPWMYWQCPQQNFSDHHAVEGEFEYETP